MKDPRFNLNELEDLTFRLVELHERPTEDELWRLLDTGFDYLDEWERQNPRVKLGVTV